VCDCVPVLLAMPNSGDVAAMHVGWRGLLAGVIENTVHTVRAVEHNHRVLAAIGPCIRSCCFVVHRDIAMRIGWKYVSENVNSSTEFVHVDLCAAVCARLKALGVTEIDVLHDCCTFHSPTHFHSYRRDGPHMGTMLASIAPKTQDL